MKRKLFVSLVLILAFSSVALAESVSSSSSSGVATDRPNTISIEALGRGGLYTLNYDHSMNGNVGVGVGASYYSASVDILTAKIFIVPIYLNYYFMSGNHRPYLTGGLDLVYVSATLKDEDINLGIAATGVAAVVGGGYEFRGDSGFLFRAAPYIITSFKSTHLWAGISLGYAF